MSVRCDSARPSKNKFPKMKKRNKTKKTSKEIQAELKHYSLPSRNTEYAVEQCKKQVQEEGKLCYCKEKCHCRSCQESKDSNARCSLETLQKESVGCTLGATDALSIVLVINKSKKVSENFWYLL